MLNTCAELFANNLREKELSFESATTDSGESLIVFPYNGKIIRMFFTGDDGIYFSLYMAFEQVPDEKLVDLIFLCNAFNSQYKWVKFYVDSDNDLTLQEDAVLSVDDTGEVAFELLIRMLTIADEIKPEIMKAIYG